jgi:polyhydroxybutyrate depolymerase
MMNLFHKLHAFDKNGCQRILFICGFFALLLMFGCQKDDLSVNDNTTDQYETGKNYFTTDIDGDVREYYVHVPSIYNSDNPTPVVFMLHGSSGNGIKYYNISKWKEVGEVENILTVFPSSWEYCIIDDGRVKTTTKWNVFSPSYEYCAGEVPRDDIKFLKQIITELNERFNVDNKRIYLVGFSNGGKMAGRCAVEMSDLFAAIVESAGTLTRDTTFVPKRKLPVLFQLGNSDDQWFGSSTIEIPMSLFDSLLTAHPTFSGIVYTHTSTFGLDTTYTMSGDTSSILTATFRAKIPEEPQVFHFTLIKDLEHNYPNGINFPLIGAELNWNWMKQYSLP